MLSSAELSEEKKVKCADIDAMIYRYKFGNDSRTKKECFAIKAYDLLISLVENNGVKEAKRTLRIGRDTDTRNLGIPTLKKFEVFWLELFHHTFVSALRDYGNKCDNITGEAISFTQLFFSYWEVESKYKNAVGALSDYGNSEEIKWRNQTAKNYLKYIADKYGKEYKLPENVITRSRFIEEVLSLGASESEANTYAEFIFEGVHFDSMDLPGNKQESEEGYSWNTNRQYVPDVNESDSTIKNLENVQAEVSTEIDKVSLQKDIHNIFDLKAFYDNLIADADITPNEKEWIRYYFTMKIIEAGNELSDKYLSVLDQGLADKILKNESGLAGKGWMNKILSDYCGLQQDTVRKKIKDVSNLLIKKRSKYMSDY